MRDSFSSCKLRSKNRLDVGEAGFETLNSIICTQLLRDGDRAEKCFLHIAVTGRGVGRRVGLVHRVVCLLALLFEEGQPFKLGHDPLGAPAKRHPQGKEKAPRPLRG